MLICSDIRHGIHAITSQLYKQECLASGGGLVIVVNVARAWWQHCTCRIILATPADVISVELFIRHLLHRLAALADSDWLPFHVNVKHTNPFCLQHFYAVYKYSYTPLRALLYCGFTLLLSDTKWSIEMLMTGEGGGGGRVHESRLFLQPTVQHTVWTFYLYRPIMHFFFSHRPTQVCNLIRASAFIHEWMKRVRPSVRPWHSGIASNQLNISSTFFTFE